MLSYHILKSLILAIRLHLLPLKTIEIIRLTNILLCVNLILSSHFTRGCLLKVYAALGGEVIVLIRINQVSEWLVSLRATSEGILLLLYTFELYSLAILERISLCIEIVILNKERICWGLLLELVATTELIGTWILLFVHRTGSTTWHLALSNSLYKSQILT